MGAAWRLAALLCAALVGAARANEFTGRIKESKNPLVFVGMYAFGVDRETTPAAARGMHHHRCRAGRRCCPQPAAGVPRA